MRTVLLALLLMSGMGRVAAQAATAQAVLTEMGSAAGVIFAGTVDSVTRSDAAGYVDVQFRVEHAVRGAQDGGVYVLREWAGLWTGGAVRYKAGQRVLMVLAGRGPSGMSAPVGGLDGAVPVWTDADGTDRVDLRWVRARALRGVAASATNGGVGDAGQAHEDPIDGEGWAGPVVPMAAGGPAAGASEPDLASILTLLGASGGR